jgi:CheY-like chemotaxis protein
VDARVCSSILPDAAGVPEREQMDQISCRSEEQLRKEAEEELRALNMRLAESDPRNGGLVHLLSHQLHDPLASISTSLHVLDRVPPGSAPARRARTVISRQIAHLTHLVDDLRRIMRASQNGLPGKGSADETGRPRVLIIEDSVDAAESLREALEFSDCEIAVAHDGPQGIATAREFRPKVVLCDIGLPGMNGFEVARTFRADKVLKDTHLVALSGYVMPEDHQRALDAGFEEHLAKPPDLGTIERLLGEMRI